MRAEADKFFMHHPSGKPERHIPNPHYSPHENPLPACHHGLQPRLTRGLRRHALRDARRKHFCPARRKRNAALDTLPAPCSAGIEVIQRPVNERADPERHQLRGRLLQVTPSFYGKFGPRAPSNSHVKKSASCSLRSLQSNGSPGISSMSAVSSCPGRVSHLSCAPSAR